MLLRSGASGGTLTVSVYGHSADVPGDIEMETVVIGPPPTVEVYRVTYLGGKMVSREYMYTDEYDVPPPPEDENPKPAADGSETEPAPAPAPAPSPAPEPEAVAGPAAPQPSPAPSAIPKKAGIL